MNPNEFMQMGLDTNNMVNPQYNPYLDQNYFYNMQFMMQSTFNLI